MSCMKAVEGGPVDREGTRSKKFHPGPKSEPRQVCLAVHSSHDMT